MTGPRRAARWLLFMLVVLAGTAGATGVYQEPAGFLDEMFGGATPEPRTLWLQPEVRARAEGILGHPPAMLRVRYWNAGDRYAWILEEVGREEPITVGIVTAAGRIEQLRVLVFRESRGWEVRHPFFTDQFRGVGLMPDDALEKPVDGISGATLSVSALSRLARLALLLHDAASAPVPEPAP
jgi:FMN-binding domain